MTINTTAGEIPGQASTWTIGPIGGHDSHALPRLASRIFNEPLMIQRQKLDAILVGLGPRLGLALDGTRGDVQPQAVMGDPQRRKPYAVTAQGIAIIDVAGVLVNRAGQIGPDSAPLTSYERLSNEILDAATDPQISGILLRFDSPGGETAGAFEAADSVAQAATVKPVWAVVDDAAYSAAYLLASQASRIIVSQTGGVGSVGIIAVHVDQSARDAEMGLKYTTLFVGNRKADFSPHAPLADDARAILQGRIESLYGMFVGAVARGRKLSTDAVAAAEAGTMHGSAAVPAWADAVGSFRQALTDLTASVRQQPASMIAAETDAPKTLAGGHEPEQIAAEAATKENDMAEEITAPVAKAPDIPAVAAPAAAVEQFGSDYALEVMDFCALANKPDMAREFIAAKLSVKEVGQKLQRLKAEAQEKLPSVSSHVAAVIGAAEDQARAQAEQIRAAEGCTIEQATVAAINRNPALYDQYLAAHPRQTGAAR